jgi:hypothetical protein
LLLLQREREEKGRKGRKGEEREKKGERKRGNGKRRRIAPLSTLHSLLSPLHSLCAAIPMPVRDRESGEVRASGPEDQIRNKRHAAVVQRDLPQGGWEKGKAFSRPNLPI